MKAIHFIFLLAFSAVSRDAARAQSASLTEESTRELRLRSIGPAVTPGRVADIAVDPRNRSIWYVATASSGLWKTSNRGTTWQPIFDDGGSYSLGSVTVDPNDSDVVWLGTGENESHRSVGFGDGLYKSTDAGQTWKRVGLHEFPAHRQESLLTRTIPKSSLPPRRGRSGRPAETVDCTKQRMAAGLGSLCSRFPKTRA